MAKKKQKAQQQTPTIKLKPVLCPCGCNKAILEPICGCRCSSVDPETARELEIRINYFERMLVAIKAAIIIVGDPGLPALEDIVAEIEDARNQKPTYKKWGE